MASKKKTTAQKLQARVTELQKTAEKTIRDGVERTFELLPAAPRKTVKGWVADLDKTRVSLRKRADKAIRDARKNVERVTSDVQKSVNKVVAPVTRTFEFASRRDLESLSKRLDQIERRLSERSTSHEHSAVA